MDGNVKRPPLSGAALLQNSLWNKGTAFTQQERDALGLNGLLPPHISSVEEQIRRIYHNFMQKKTPLGRYIYLLQLLDRNEHLFYQFIDRNPAEMLPFIYTPTVGAGSVMYSMLYSHQRGLYLSYPLESRMEEMIANYPAEDVQIIVATDGERVLGLGDQGLGGMAISIGKLSLYTVFGGIHPSKTLPIVLDVGTNNAEHLANELYLGWRHRRVQGQEYDSFIERFVQAIRKRYPHALLQWEDFGKSNASRILEKYRKSYLSFNDDIQGTGAVALAALFSGIKISRGRLDAQRIVILGGGSAGVGIAKMILMALQQEGLSKDDALRRLFVIDSHGLLHSGCLHVDSNQSQVLYPEEFLQGWELNDPGCIQLMDVIKNVHPTALIGVCGQGGIFTKEIVQEMAKHIERPIILPLSNPTSKAEATPGELIEWTHGKAIIATGSPFDPVHYLDRTISIAQCNNVYIFPAIGLGALAAQAKEVTDTMFLEAANILANYSPALADPKAALFPPLTEVRSVCREIAIGVAKRALKEKVGTSFEKEIEGRIDSLMWKPAYPRFV